MSVLHLVAMLIFSFGALAFGAAFLGMLVECRGKHVGASAIVDGVLTFTCFFWFVINALLTLTPLIPGAPDWLLWTVLMGVALIFPGLILHDTVTGSDPGSRGSPHPIWKLAVVLQYTVGLTVYLFWLAAVYRWADLPRNTVLLIGNASIPALFITTAVLSMVYVGRRRRGDDAASQRPGRRGHLILLGVMVLVFVPLTLHLTLDVPYTELFSVLSRSLPLAFLFVFMFSEDRFAFFDVLIKRGVVMLFTLALLAGAFALTLPWLDRLELGRARPWFYAYLLLPLALVLPWLSRKLGQFLDDFWLGRRFTAEEAIKHFLAGLQDATTEQELIAGAERGLREVFRAPARVSMGLHAAPEDDAVVVEVKIRSGGEVLGALRMGRRDNDMPYFSQDVALLGSLSGVFAAFLESIRLQRRKQQQEQLAQELSLQASRSELKALRAQIDPHFLFNALNAIAGLIHHDPLRADRAVEQLAEVFRYTLRGSQREWATLEQELDFARAYLEVEQARFGPRLETHIEADPQVLSLRVPAMLLQTLIENAVKHGIAAVRGGGRLEIKAARDESYLVVEVADNGPGFSLSVAGDDDGENGGYGLSNVRRRLLGHFGDEAELTVRRDDQAGLTIVGLKLPVDRLASEPGAAGGAATS